MYKNICRHRWQITPSPHHETDKKLFLKQLWAVDRVGMGVGVGESLIKAANGARQTDRRGSATAADHFNNGSELLISDRRILVQRDGVLNPEEQCKYHARMVSHLLFN